MIALAIAGYILSFVGVTWWMCTKHTYGPFRSLIDYFFKAEGEGDWCRKGSLRAVGTILLLLAPLTLACLCLSKVVELCARKTALLLRKLGINV